MNDFDSSRRAFLCDMGLGFGGVALSAMLQQEALSETAAAANAIAPKAKSVIWMFMLGGASHLESFDPKPKLNEFAGKTISETPFADVLNSPFQKNQRDIFDSQERKIATQIYPLQTGFSKRGKSGLEISDWFPHVAECADDLCLIRSMWTEDIDHGAQLQFHTGRHRIEGFFPTIGSWVSYGLGSINQDLPRFVVLGRGVSDCCGGKETHRANYLGPQYDGVPLSMDAKSALPFATPPEGVFKEEQAAEFKLLNRLHGINATQFPNDETLRARVQSYELAFRMQTAVPEVVRFQEETKETQEMYGLGQETTNAFGEQLLTARRLVERGVRFVQVYHGGDSGAGLWDGHMNHKERTGKACMQVDKPIAGLLKDLKQRGQLDETLVVWATEFGRTPGSQFGNGRDHHPHGFTVWMAGGGIKGGMAHGATDELGYHAVEHRHYVTDIHATVLHQLGLDPRKLSVPGRKRLERDYGNVIQEILA